MADYSWMQPNVKAIIIGGKYTEFIGKVITIATLPKPYRSIFYGGMVMGVKFKEDACYLEKIKASHDEFPNFLYCACHDLKPLPECKTPDWEKMSDKKPIKQPEKEYV